MKKFLQIVFLSLAVTLSAVEGRAQINVYHPFPDSNVVWREWRSGWNSGINGHSFDYMETLAGDTLIGGITYKKILETGEENFNGSFSYYYDLYKGGISQDTSQHKVFFIPPSGSTNTQLYDFNVSVGDTMHSLGFIISSIDSILVGSNYRKRLRSTKGVDIIEGIGSTWGLLCQVLGYLNHQNELYCFMQNGQTIYRFDTTQSCPTVPTGIDEFQENSFFKISPNPSSGIFTLSSSDKISSVEILDVLGKQVFKKHASTRLSMTFDLSSHPKGIYFVKVMDEKGNFGVKKIILE